MKGNKIKGFKGCYRLFLDVCGNSEEFVVTKHFEHKAYKVEDCFSLYVLRDLVYNSIVIVNRPRNLSILLKNNLRKAIYLYNKRRDLVFVLEEDTISGEYRIFKTIYKGSESMWVNDWMNQNQKDTRIKFKDYFKNNTLEV